MKRRLTLLNVVAAFPDGGARGLSERLRTSRFLVYKFAEGKHRREPVVLAGRIADAFGARKVFGRHVTRDWLLDLWADIRATVTAKRGRLVA